MNNDYVDDRLGSSSVSPNSFLCRLSVTTITKYDHDYSRTVSSLIRRLFSWYMVTRFEGRRARTSLKTTAGEAT